MNPNDPAFAVDLVFTGLTKREYFAAMAMQGSLANPDLSKHIDKLSHEAKIETMNGVAGFAINCADALIAELSK